MHSLPKLAKRAILCLIAIVFAGYLLGWFLISLNQEHMGDVAKWGADHGILSWQSNEGAWVAPGLLWNPQTLLTTTTTGQ